MIDRSKAILFGSFGGWNSGDEAILESVERLLGWSETNLPTEPLNQVAVICFRIRDGYLERYRSRGRNVVLAKSLLKLTNLLRARQLIIGGGQIITGDRSYKSLLFLLALTTLARLFGKPAIMVGIGVEGVHRRFAKLLCRLIVANVNVLHCRDSFSQNMLIDSGCDTDRLKLSADVVLSGVIASPNISSSATRRTIAVGLHCARSRTYASADEFEELAMSILREFIDYDVVMVSNDCRDGFDDELLRVLQRRIAHPRVKFQAFDYVENVVAAYATAKCVISVRMHPLILALIHGVPVIGIARSNKVKALAKRISFDLIDPKLEPPDVWLGRVHKAIESPPPEFSKIKQLATEQFLT